jgi:hypothetical protein
VPTALRERLARRLVDTDEDIARVARGRMTFERQPAVRYHDRRADSARLTRRAE